MTALICATLAGHTEVVKELLIAGADVNKVIIGSSMLARQLAFERKDADVVSAIGNYYWTPLIWAAFKGHLEVVKVLIAEKYDGCTPSSKEDWNGKYGC